MSKPFQFSLRSLFVATTLIAVGFAALADSRTAFKKSPPLNVFHVIEALASFPLIGAGLFTLVKRPILGAFLGSLCFIVFLLLWAIVTGEVSQ